MARVQGFSAVKAGYTAAIPSRTCRLGALVVVALLACASLLPAVAQDPPRVVAIGDIHGSLDGFTSILRETGLIDERRRWSGGRSILVQTGDFSDRGDDVRGVMDLLMALEREARAAGGQVITLLGNHEIMVLLGEFRDVTPAICATFADARSESRRDRAWRQYSSLAAARARASTEIAPVYGRTREDWIEARPLGCLEYREALAPRGKYGAWLRGKPIAAVVDGTLFMHAGASPELEVDSIEALNSRVRNELARFDRFTGQLVRARLALPSFTMIDMLEVASDQIRIANDAIIAAREGGPPIETAGLDIPLVREAAEVVRIGEWWLLAPQGPLWYRGYALASDEELTAPFTAMLPRLGATRMVVGHTVMSDFSILARLDARLFLIDTGMLAPVYRGRASALELLDGRATAIYEDGRVVLAPQRNH